MENSELLPEYGALIYRESENSLQITASKIISKIGQHNSSLWLKICNFKIVFSTPIHAIRVAYSHSIYLSSSLENQSQNTTVYK